MPKSNSSAITPVTRMPMMTTSVTMNRTNRSFGRFNNTLCLSPALTLAQAEADAILAILDQARAQVAQTLG